MNAITLPGFTAERSLHAAHGRYSSAGSIAASTAVIIPAIPPCSSCEALLDYCATHGGRPRAACMACLSGNCDPSNDRPGGSQCWYDPFLHRTFCTGG